MRSVASWFKIIFKIKDATPFFRWRGYNPKKRGRASHHPLLAFLGSGYVINVWNRSGNSSAGHGAVSFFHQTRMVLKASFRINRVLCDSGFYEIEFIEYLELNKLTYIISVPNILPPEMFTR
jgi:hypothetical protein